MREALTKIGDKLTPELVLAESFEQTKPTEWTVKLRNDIHYSDKSKVTVEDVETALRLYFEVKAGYVASQFPEQPTFTKVDDTTFTARCRRLPVPGTRHGDRRRAREVRTACPGSERESTRRD